MVETSKGITQRHLDFYKDKSLQGAKNVRSDLLSAPKKIVFSKQYQIDEINPNYRRIVIREYKVLYKEENNNIEVVDIVGTRQSPEIIPK